MEAEPESSAGVSDTGAADGSACGESGEQMLLRLLRAAELLAPAAAS